MLVAKQRAFTAFFFVIKRNDADTSIRNVSAGNSVAASNAVTATFHVNRYARRRSPPPS